VAKKLDLYLQRHILRKNLNTILCGLFNVFSGGNEYKSKGTALLVQAYSGPEVSTRLRLPDFNTTGT
jgi:hypothetical protein